MSSQTQKRPRRSPSRDVTAPIDSEADGSSVGADKRRPRRRHANVYEAVAGRVTTTVPIDDDSDSEQPRPPRYRRRYARDSRRDPTFAPEEVLFKRSGAPIRYAEKDIYHAHEGLRDGGRGILPDSDMLKAVHSYASHFYASLAARDDASGEATAPIDERSMDETALMAFGILLDEAGRDALGSKGDLVFTEGVAVEAVDGEDEDRDGGAETFGFKDAKKLEQRSRSGLSPMARAM